MTLTVDLLASRFNNKLDRFVSRYRDPLAEAVAALVLLQDQCTPISAFSQLKLLPRLLCRIELECIPVILTDPDWPRQMWYLVRLLADLLSQRQICHPDSRICFNSIVVEAQLLRDSGIPECHFYDGQSLEIYYPLSLLLDVEGILYLM